MNKKQTRKMMITIERFSQLLDAYGGDAKRWPLEERAAALKLLEVSSEAHHLQQSALTLDNLLNRIPISSPTTALRNHIIAKIQKSTKPTKDAWQWLVEWLLGTTTLEHVLRPAFALALPLLLGITIGLNLTALPEIDEQQWVFEDEINLLALGPLE
ncbi:hypothetical protein [Candidatus Parabeggiatoa sp. HSG14]|uniref:hypothetical protein n=1 Tax=Candidatus Parabeggiatoa sp. HSG14 TaxID=3055593 RepID=UPI0025A6AAA6|nr:hypothetical protein [Thiotrichales bacterium HSG14]